LANRDKRRVESSARLSALLNRLETALPTLAGAGTMAEADWSDIDRRLNGVRSILADGMRGRGARRTRRGARSSGRANDAIVSLFG